LDSRFLNEVVMPPPQVLSPFQRSIRLRNTQVDNGRPAEVSLLDAFAHALVQYRWAGRLRLTTLPQRLQAIVSAVFFEHENSNKKTRLAARVC
jgi:hypothetical protein